MGEIFTQFFSFLFSIAEQLISLGNTLYDALTYEITISDSLIPDFIFPGDLSISLWGLLGGVGVLVLILWHLMH